MIPVPDGALVPPDSQGWLPKEQGEEEEEGELPLAGQEQGEENREGEGDSLHGW